MTGLDKILNEIQTESESKAKQIIDEAEKSAQDILKQAEIQAQKEVQGINSKTENAEKDIMKRAESAGELAIRKAVLGKKQELIQSIISSAKERLLNLPDEEYFAFLTKALNKFAHKETGEILLSKKDTLRLTDSFKKAFIEKGLTLSERFLSEEGGFILVYGDIEEKCTFSALFDAKQDELTDIVIKTVFY